MKSDFSKFYKFKEKETDNICTSQMSINQFSKEELSNVHREIDVISNINHPNILKFIRFSPIDFKNERKPVIVMELISNRTLDDILSI